MKLTEKEVLQLMKALPLFFTDYREGIPACGGANAPFNTCKGENK